MSTTARHISRSLAPLLALLELEQPRVISREGLATWAREVGIGWPVDVVVQRLRERGWLLDLKTRGVWEFAPGARAGAFDSGDPLIELRATLERRRDAPCAVAAESAAFFLGYASRRPEREVVAVPSGFRVPPALRDYRVVRWPASQAIIDREGLPVWSPSMLLVFMAVRPSQYRDWPNVGEWLPTAIADADATAVRRDLADEPRSAWARAAYLFDRGGSAPEAARLMKAAPQGAGPYYLGARERSGIYAKTYDVIDSTGMEVGAA